MRKALIGLILAATAMTPAVAEAQNWRERGGDSDETRAERVQQRQERQAARQAQQQAPQQIQAQQAQQAPQAQVVERQRGNWQGRGDGGNRGSWQGRTDNGAAAYQRRNDNGAAAYQGNANNGAAAYQGRNDGRNRGSYQGGNRQGSIYPQAWQGDPNDPRLRHYQELERRNQQRYGNDGRNWRNDDNRGSRTSWNRNWRNDNRYDWQRWRYSNRNIFHIGPYYSPYRGYGYNRFSIGVFLDPFFYDQRYWIGDPWQYRLPPAEPGTEWVRYYNDVLLVDVYTGEVLDTIYDFFW